MNPNSSYTKDRIQIYANVIDIGHAKFSYMKFIDFLVTLTKVKCIMFKKIHLMFNILYYSHGSLSPYTLYVSIRFRLRGGLTNVVEIRRNICLVSRCLLFENGSFTDTTNPNLSNEILHTL